MFLLRGDKTIIVDTGRPGNETRILQALEQRNISPADVSLILLTHGHFDHFGSVRTLKQKLNVPVAIHHLDQVALKNGKDPALHPTRFTGKLLKLFLHGKTKGLEPDIIIHKEFDLHDYGVAGRVIHTPGHTPGSLSIVFENHDVIIGDLLMGGHLGGLLSPRTPNIHYFAEDIQQVHNSIHKVMSYQPNRVFVGHGGPLRAVDIKHAFHIPVDKVKL